MESQGFVVDTTGDDPSSRYFPQCPFYIRETEETLGESIEEDPPQGPEARRCFNCGSPAHILPACPIPPNHALIRLSRQIFLFQNPNSGENTGNERVHVVEQWKQRRLDWVRDLEPGKVQGGLLRDALGLDDSGIEHDGEWLRNMALWGYPPGWESADDPREAVRARIHGQSNESYYDGEDFVIFGDAEEELVDLSVSTSRPSITQEDSDTDAASDAESETSTLSSRSVTPSPNLRRWAIYPSTYFSSSLLPHYTRFALPPVPFAQELSSDSKSTFTSDRQDLWTRILSTGTSTLSPTVDPQRITPPEPTTKPPPLPADFMQQPPPSPPPSSSPPLPSRTLGCCDENENESSDMELSDSE